MKTDPAAIVSLALAREEHARESIFRHCRPSIVAMARRVLGPGRSQEDVDEVVQASYLVLVEKLPQFKGESGGQIAAYAGAIAANLAKQYLSKFGRNEQSFEQIPMVIEDPGPLSESVVDNSEFLGILLKQLQEQLSPIEQKCFELIFMREYTYKEAAVALGIRREYLDVIINHIRKKARKVDASLRDS